MKGDKKDNWWLMWILAAVVIFLIVWSSGIVHAQTVTPIVVMDPVPEFNTWQEALAFYWPKILQTLLVLISGAVAWMLRTAVAMLPQFIREWIDDKRQRDLHSAIMSAVATMMQEGRWPTAEELRASGGVLTHEVIGEIRDYANKSVNDATRRFGIEIPSAFSDKIFDTLAKRMAAQLGISLEPVPTITVAGVDDMSQAIAKAIRQGNV